MITDEEIDGMFEPYQETREESPEEAATLANVPAQPGALPFQFSQVPPTVPGGGVMDVVSRKVGPLPVWAWALIGVGVGGAGYLYYRYTKKDGDGSVTSNHGLEAFEDETESKGTWGPSRSAFAKQLERYFARRGQNAHVTVWSDAEEAKSKGRLAFVSPLINIQVKGGTVKPDAGLMKFCRREGLNPVAHKDGSIGLYPHEGGKRGKAWEDYVDALRDDGQAV
jgi:hypothetical protein